MLTYSPTCLSHETEVQFPGTISFSRREEKGFLHIQAVKEVPGAPPISTFMKHKHSISFFLVNISLPFSMKPARRLIQFWKTLWTSSKVRYLDRCNCLFNFSA
jgi:hypothetical protein